MGKYTVADMPGEISWSDFEKVDIRVGKIISARPFPEARKPAYILEVDFGDIVGIRKSSAQLTKHYNPDELIGRLVAGVTNFPKKQIGPVQSEVLIVGFPDESGEPVLLSPDHDVPLGGKLF